MLMQHVVGVRYLEYYRATIYTMKHSAMSEIAKMNRPPIISNSDIILINAVPIHSAMTG